MVVHRLIANQLNLPSIGLASLELIMGFLDLFKNKNNKLKPNTLAYVLADCKKFKIDTIIMFTAKTWAS